MVAMLEDTFFGTDNSKVASEVSIVGGGWCFLIELVPSRGKEDVE